MWKYRIALVLMVTCFMSIGALAQRTITDKRELRPIAAAQTSASDLVDSGLRMQANATAAATPSFAFVVVSGGGLARLSLINGGIQFCQLTDANERPTSRCVKIGAIPISNLASAQLTFVPTGHIVVTNLVTGVMVDCTVVLNSNFIAGTPSGSCITLTPGS